MGWLGRGALVASVIAVATCTPPEPPRDAGPMQLDTATVDVPVDLLLPPDDADVVLDEMDAGACPADCAPDALGCTPELTTCAPTR
jgi:hypothetical protein